MKLKSSLPPPIRTVLHLAKVRAKCAIADVLEFRRRREGSWPPSLMRFRVHGAADLNSYARVGEQCAKDVLEAVRIAGVDPSRLESVLDFGAGCGRTLRFLQPLIPRARFAACDVDAESVAWGKAHHAGDWRCTADLPPLPFADARFDLVYAISVFTHLDERRQFAWLAELRRVTKPGGLMLVTVMPGQNELEAIGHANWKGLFPAWYQDTAHSEDYVRREFSRHASLIGVLPRAMNHHQTVVLLQRPAETSVTAD